MGICKKTGQQCPLDASIERIGSGNLSSLYSQDDDFIPELGINPGQEVLDGFVNLARGIIDEGDCKEGPGQETVTPADNMGENGWERTFCQHSLVDVLDNIAQEIFEVPIGSTFIIIPAHEDLDIEHSEEEEDDGGDLPRSESQF